MNDIQVGDRVTWQERTRVRPYLHTKTGVVTCLLDAEFVEVLWHGQVDCLPRKCLTVVHGAVELVADADYHLLTSLAGDLSGAELT